MPEPERLMEYKKIPVNVDWTLPRKCKKCGREYNPVKSEQKYCPECGKNEKTHRPASPRYEKGKTWHKTCPECGAEFDTIYQYQIYDKKQCRYRVNSRRKYRRDILVYPGRAKHHAERRRVNSKAWREQHRENGNCIRCGEPLMPGNSNSVCDECRRHVGKNI